MAKKASEPDPEVLNRVAAFLSEFPGYAFCNDCLSSRLSLNPKVAWSAAVALGDSPEFEVDHGVCSHCLDQIEDVAHVRWELPSDETKPEPHRKPRIRFTAGSSGDNQ